MNNGIWRCPPLPDSIIHILVWFWCIPCIWYTPWSAFVICQQPGLNKILKYHYHWVIMGAIASPITSLTIVYSTVYSSADQRKHQSSASLAFVRELHRWAVNFPHKWPVTRKIFPLVTSTWYLSVMILINNKIYRKNSKIIVWQDNVFPSFKYRNRV